MKYICIVLLLLTAGCTAHPYTVCRGEDYCTPALSHEEAIRASKPDIDAHVEALKAKGMARADILSVRAAGN